MEEIRKRRRKVDTRDGREKEEEKGVKLTRGKERSSHTYCSVSSTVPWRLLFRVAYFSVAVVNPQPQSRQSAKLFLQSSELELPQPLTRRRV
jgi:hypothetical protein